MDSSTPTVAIWKTSWLPASQTFVQNQVGAMRRWHPVLIGAHQLSDGLPVVADRAPFGRSVPARVAHRLSRATGYLGVFDRLLTSSGVRVIHAHFGTGGVAVAPVARRLGLPLVVTFHGFDVTRETQRSDRAGLRYQRRLRRLFDQADTLIAVSQFIADRLVALGADPSRIRIHHIGIPVETAPVGTGEDRSGVVFVGRLVDKKGVADLLEAMAALGERARGVPVRIVGDGPLRSQLEERARRAGLDVRFLGFRTAAEVAQVLRESAVFCAPSRTAPDGDAEAFGMVFLEAALQGLPVVSYRHGGVPEAVEEGVTALLAPEGDVAALTAHLRTLLDDPDLARSMGEAGRARVLRDFDVVRQSALLEDLYAEAATRSPRPPGSTVRA